MERAADRSGAGGACVLKQPLLQRQVCGEERRGEGGRGPGPGCSAGEGERRLHLAALVGLLGCSVGSDSATPWTSPPGSSVRGSSQARMLSGVPFPPPGGLPNPGMEPTSLASPAWQAGSLPLAPLGSLLTGCGSCEGA